MAFFAVIWSGIVTVLGLIGVGVATHDPGENGREVRENRPPYVGEAQATPEVAVEAGWVGAAEPARPPTDSRRGDGWVQVERPGPADRP